MFHGRNTNSEYVFQPLNISSNIFERNNIPSISRISVASISISRSTSHNNPSLHNIVTIRTDRLTDRDRRREDAITRAKRWKKEKRGGSPCPRWTGCIGIESCQPGGERVMRAREGKFFFHFHVTRWSRRARTRILAPRCNRYG